MSDALEPLFEPGSATEAWFSVRSVVSLSRYSLLMLPNLEAVREVLVSLVDRAFAQMGDIARENKEDGSFVTVMDTHLQALIYEALSTRWPAIGFLGEEMSREAQASALSYEGEQAIWVLDPLDGTTNFSTGLPLYGVSLALVVAGRSQLAVVYDPTRQECFSAQAGQGAWLNGQRLGASQRDGQPRSGAVVSELSECIANVDYKRLTRDLAAQLVTCPPYRSQRNIGACVLEWCWLATGRIQLYLHGGQQLWDHAAGHLILLEAGGMAKTLEGEPLCSDVLHKQSAVAASSPALYAQWRDWIALQDRACLVN